MKTTINSNKQLLALALLTGLLLSTACHKEQPEPEAVPLSAELKAYTLFQPGSYWIYQDSASRQLDSVWVVSTDMSVLRIGNGSGNMPHMKHEDFRLRTRSTLGGADQVYSVRRVCSLPFREDADSKGACWFVQRGQYLPNSTADEGGADVFPYLIERDKTTPLFTSTAELYPYWHSRPQLIGGQSYEGVLEVKVTTDASEGGWPAHYYWAPNKGIVRQRVRVNNVRRTRTLIRSNIVQ